MCSLLLLMLLTPPTIADEAVDFRGSPPILPTLPVPLVGGAKTWESVRAVMRAPTLRATSQADEFLAKFEHYLWYLDHPDLVSRAWRRLGVASVDIASEKDGGFSWRDGTGSQLRWYSVGASVNGRVWYAEGKINPGKLLPMVPVKAVAVVRHMPGRTETDEPTVTHSVEVYLLTDSRAASLALKVLGPSAPKMAQDAADQLLLFFSGIARYVYRYPQRANALFLD